MRKNKTNELRSLVRARSKNKTTTILNSGVNMRASPTGYHISARRQRRVKGGGSSCNSWTLSVRYDAEKDIYYGRVGVGFHGYKRPEPFIKDGKDVSFYEVSLAGKLKSQQVGLRVPFKAMVSQTEYVLPTTLAQGTAVAEGEEPKPMTIVVEDFDNYRFTFDLPRDKEAEGDVVMPIGSFVQIKTQTESESGAITTTESWAVGQQLVSCDNTGVFSPFAGYTIY